MDSLSFTRVHVQLKRRKKPGSSLLCSTALCYFWLRKRGGFKNVDRLCSLASLSLQWHFASFFLSKSLQTLSLHGKRLYHDLWCYGWRNQRLTFILGLPPTQTLHSKCGVRFLELKVMANRQLRFSLVAPAKKTGNALGSSISLCWFVGLGVWIVHHWEQLPPRIQCIFF